MGSKAKMGLGQAKGIQTKALLYLYIDIRKLWPKGNVKLKEESSVQVTSSQRTKEAP